MSNSRQHQNLISHFKIKVSSWLLATLDPVFLIVHVTIIFLFFLAGDSLVLAAINFSFGSAIEQSSFTEDILKAIKLFSALGTALAYFLHLTYSLYQEGKHVAKVLRHNSGVKELAS